MLHEMTKCTSLYFSNTLMLYVVCVVTSFKNYQHDTATIPNCKFISHQLCSKMTLQGLFQYL